MSEDAAEQPVPAPNGWGQPISAERQTYLDALVERQNLWREQPVADRGISPYAGVPLTGADVFWLAARALAEPQGDIADAAARLRDPNYRAQVALSSLHLEGAQLFNAHLEDAVLKQAHLEGAGLLSAYLQRADLYDTHLERAYLAFAHLEEANLIGAHLEGAILSSAHLERANLTAAHLEGSNLHSAHLEEAVFGDLGETRNILLGAHLEGVKLNGARLKGAQLYDAHLEGATLTGAHLEGTALSGAHLEGKTYSDEDAVYKSIRQWAWEFPATLPTADLREVVCDAATVLKDITLGDARHGAVRVADVRWGGANLAVVDWTPLTELNARLGDEQAAWDWQPDPFKPPDAQSSDGQSPEGKPSRQALRVARAEHATGQAKARLEVFRAAVRANRQLATALRDQGLNEEADHFAYRAQVVQRAVFRQQGKRGRWFFSGFLDLIAGYGYQPLRSVGVYLLVIGVFALSYWLLGPVAGHTFAPDGALVFSLTSFHGRGFFPGGLDLENWITRLAALEAVLGLIIEISFIATFTQRFFGK